MSQLKETAPFRNMTVRVMMCTLKVLESMYQLYSGPSPLAARTKDSHLLLSRRLRLRRYSRKP